ncbi:hypothetical protein ACWKYF_18080 [Enterobacter asburiae]
MPWLNQYGFNYKNMVFQNSCFPNCLQMVLANFGSYSRNDILENQWDTLQVAHHLPGLAAQAPNEDDVNRNLARTDLKGAGCRIITPSMLGDYVNRQALEQEAQHYLADYSAMIIGVGHATVIYRTSTGFVHVIPSPDINQVHVEHYANLDIDVVEHQGQHAVRVINRANGQPIIAGTFVMLLRP